MSDITPPCGMMEFVSYNTHGHEQILNKNTDFSEILKILTFQNFYLVNMKLIFLHDFVFRFFSQNFYLRSALSTSNMKHSSKSSFRLCEFQSVLAQTSASRVLITLAIHLRVTWRAHTQRGFLLQLRSFVFLHTKLN